MNAVKPTVRRVGNLLDLAGRGLQATAIKHSTVHLIVLRDLPMQAASANGHAHVEGRVIGLGGVALAATDASR